MTSLNDIRIRCTSSWMKVMAHLKSEGLPDNSLQQLQENFSTFSIVESPHLPVGVRQVNNSDSVNSIRTMMTQQTKTTIHSIKMAQEYAKCYPCIKIEQLVLELADVWEAYADLKSFDLHQVQRNIASMKNDPRMSSLNLATMQLVLQDVLQTVTWTHVNLYKIRLLRKLYQEQMAHL